MSGIANIRKNPSWKLFWDKGQLIASGGGDEIFLIDGLNAQNSQKLFDAYTRDNLNSLESAGPELKDALNRLLRAKIVFYSTFESRSRGEPLKVRLVWVGSENPELEKIFTGLVNKSKSFCVTAGQADAEVYIRTNGKFSDLLEIYRPAAVPHLFVDLAYSHTISLGPLVIFGQTACLSCFCQRLMHSWGDAEPPSDPHVLKNTALAAALVFLALKQSFGEDKMPELIETVFSLNLEKWSSQKDPVFRLPWCKICFPDNLTLKAEPFPLAWVETKI